MNGRVPARVRPGTRELGFVAVEWAASVALLLLPVVVLVATLPVWAERRHAATIAAREAANALARAWPGGAPGDAVREALETMRRLGVDPAEVAVRVPDAGAARGDSVRVEVEVTMPAIAVLGMSAGAWRDTVVASRRIDDYRSR